MLTCHERGYRQVLAMMGCIGWAVDVGVPNTVVVVDGTKALVSWVRLLNGVVVTKPSAEAVLLPVARRRWKPVPLTIATWLILPVVICLSQRLSHACLSINCFILWNCEWLIKSVIVYLMVPYYSDNRSNSRANTCANPDFRKGRIY